VADTKISALTAAGSALTTHEYPVNEAGTTKKVTGTQLQTLILTAPHFAAGSATADSKPELTSGTVLTTPEDGAIEYDGASQYFTSDTTSGRAAACNEQIFRLAANLSTRGGTIADYFDANSAFPYVTNGVYELEWDLVFLKTTAGTLTWTLVLTQAPTNVVTSWDGSVITGISATGAISEAALVTQTGTSIVLPVTGSLSNATNHRYKIRVMLEAATAGNIRLRCTVSAGTLTPLRGSLFKARRLPAGNVGTYVA
jgi:hypothetical protein